MGGISQRIPMNDLKQIEDSIMAHRYLYYVLSQPVVSDFIYDALERDAREVLSLDSPVHGVGSSLRDSYTPDQIALANQRLYE